MTLTTTRLHRIGHDVSRSLPWVVSGSFVLTTVLWFVSSFYWFGINFTPSLPYTLLVIDKRAAVGHQDLVAFPYAGHALAGRVAGITMLKRVVGMPADSILVDRRNVSVAGHYVGHALFKTSTGEPLVPVSPGVVPDGFLFVAGDHPMSFDSRYREFGFVDQSHVIGKAIAVF
jgi:conjugal transfer pilin signal peptidase TrbI